MKPSRRCEPLCVVVTATGTGAGKTVFTAALVAWLRRKGEDAIALKPLASGGREDAELLHAAQDRALALDAINPWLFDEPLAPLLAARRSGRRVTPTALVDHVRDIARGAGTVLVEGAGGILSPLVEGMDVPELIVALRARPVLVAPNVLGVVSHLRLAWNALPAASRRHAQVVLMTPRVPDLASSTNAGLLADYLPAERIHMFPRLTKTGLRRFGAGVADAVLAEVARGLGIAEIVPRSSPSVSRAPIRG